MYGSEKQIAWATKIRDSRIAEYNDLKSAGKFNADNIDEIDACFGRILSNEYAEWWIDHRGLGVINLLVQQLRMEMA